MARQHVTRRRTTELLAGPACLAVTLYLASAVPAQAVAAARGPGSVAARVTEPPPSGPVPSPLRGQGQQPDEPLKKGMVVVAGEDGATIVMAEQCLKPQAERVGGWMCPEKVDTAGRRVNQPASPSTPQAPSTAATIVPQTCYSLQNTCWYAGTDNYRGRYSQNNVSYGYSGPAGSFSAVQQSSATYALNGWQASGRLNWKATRTQTNVTPTAYTYSYDGHGSSASAGGPWSAFWGTVAANTTASSVWTSYYKGASGWYYTGFGVTFRDASAPGSWGFLIPSAIYWCTSGATVPCSYASGAVPPNNVFAFWVGP